MPRYTQRDKDGNVTETLIVTEETLQADPDAVITLRGPKGTRARTAPEGYEHISSLDSDPDGIASNVTVHVYAKKGSYQKEKASKLAGLKAVVAQAEASKEEGGAPKL